MNNYTSGSGDPYWYEWSVGLLYAVKMLNPDNQIANVVLQSTDSHSLDDVVVTYTNGTIECIQVKNTRENDILSFSDMINKGKDGKSYLYKFSSDWKKMSEKKKSNCKVILFTNREIGERKYTPKGSWQRPPLLKFWSQISSQLENNTATSILDIKIDEEWNEAWSTWINEMRKLSDEEKYTFLKNLTIMTNQQDLDGLISTINTELQVTFDITYSASINLHQKLCYKLMWWATHLRDKEEINSEDVMEALSVDGDHIIGSHNFPLCEPFFSSRIDFINTLENTIINGKSKVTFISGEPGCGKTNLVTYLACKPDSIVTLRFHTFKPILPGELYFAPDEGVFDSKVFWGNFVLVKQNCNTRV